MYVYQNYHKHSERTNPVISDSTVTYKDYAEAAKGYGHTILSSAEHGYQGRYIETYDTAKEYGLKCLIGAEAYWVKDRTAPDNTNCHIWIGAKNENGRQALNDILSEGSLSGFYYRPRIDVPLILSLPKDDVWITTACVAYWKYEDIDAITAEFAKHFGGNFYLEAQYHNTESQKKINAHILELHNKLKVPLIMGCDSHYITANQAQTRDDFLVSKGIKYEDEEGWFLDYPDGQTAYNRFAEQNVLSHSDIVDAIANTNTFLDVAEYDNPIFNTDIKLPTLYDGEHTVNCTPFPKLDQAGRDEEYKRLVWNGWEEYKKEIPKPDWAKYEEEIQKEIQTVIDCHMSDYFIDNYYIIRKGKENGGWLTKTGRGSAVSNFTNNLLGFTEVDRIAAKVKMYPERFMSADRILKSGSLPDIDFNVAPVEPFMQAQKDILGEDHAYPMIAYGTYQKSAAWKLYAKAKGVDFETANAVSEQLKKYEMALKHADEDAKDDINVLDFIDDKFKQIYEDSKDYMGLITSWSIAPSASLLYQGSIRKEVGLIRIKENLCCLMDGAWAEKNHLLKNDLLKVSVVDLIYRAYHRVGMEPPSQKDLLDMVPPEDKTWELYKTGCTLGLNQVEQPGTSSRVGKYAPTNISELCAFVAAIRPGFKSMYKTFETKEHFDYGVKQFDDLIQTEEMPNSFLLYQEHIMAALAYAGIPMSEGYTVIKAISKKRVEKIMSYKDKFIDGFSAKLVEDGVLKTEAKPLSEKLWQIIEDSSSYSFNACLTNDTVMTVFYPQMHGESKVTLENLYDEWVPGKILWGLSRTETGEYVKNRIVDVRYAGYRMTYHVVLDNGKMIVCTHNHKFPTVENGVRRCDELEIGEKLYHYTKGKESIVTVKQIRQGRYRDVYDVEMAAPNHNFVLANGLVVSNSHSYCVSLDSVYSAWIKAHYPLAFYETLLQIQEDKGKKDKMVETKREAEEYFKITFPPYRFGQDNRAIRANFERGEIHNSIKAIKGLPKTSGDLLWEVAAEEPKTMIDVLFSCKRHKVTDATIEALSKIGYFSSFGNDVEIFRIIDQWQFYKKGEAKKIKREAVQDPNVIAILQRYATDTNDSGEPATAYTITSPEIEAVDKQIKAAKKAIKAAGEDVPAELTAELESLMAKSESIREQWEQKLLNEIERYILSLGLADLDYRNKAQNQTDVLGYADLTTGKEEDRRKLVVEDVEAIKDKKTGNVWCYRVGTRSIGSGKTARLSVKPGVFEETPLKKGDVIFTPQGSLKKNAKGYWYLSWYDIII